MKHLIVAAVCALSAGVGLGQMSVTSYDLSGGYSATAFSGSGSGTFSVSEPDGYLAVIPETTLGDATGLLSANVFGVLESGPIEDGFRMAGFVLSDVQTTPFYSYNHRLTPLVSFDLSEPTEIRIQGTITVEPEVASLDFVPNNGTVFELRPAGSLTTLFIDWASPFPDDRRERSIDATVLLPAGSYEAYVDAFSNIGAPLSPGLLNEDTWWDLNITVVPAPATIAIAPMALLASRRRR